MTLTEFLTARIDEDEAWGISEDCAYQQDPERLLREVEAKRAIVADYVHAHGRDRGDLAAAGALLALHRVAYLLATVYADHPNYREEWRP